MDIGTGLWFGSRGLTKGTDAQKRKILGQFNKQTGSMVIRSADDLRTMAHELAHFLCNGKGKGLLSTNDLLGYDVVEELRKFRNDDVTLETLEEGFAEFISAYVNDPAMANAIAPNTYELFSRDILARNKDITELMRELQWIIRAKNNLGIWESGPGDPLALDKSKVKEWVTPSFWRERWMKITGGLPLGDALMKMFISRQHQLAIVDKAIDAAGNKRKFANRLYEQGRSLNAKIAGRTEAFLLHGNIDPETGVLENYIDPATNDIDYAKAPFGVIIRPILQRGAHNLFSKFLIALRTLERGVTRTKTDAYGNSVEIDAIRMSEYMSPEQALALIEEAGFRVRDGADLNAGIKPADIELAKPESPTADFIDIAKRVYGYQDRLMAYAAAKGMFSDAQLKEIKMLNEFYVPFTRVFGETAASGLSGSILEEDGIKKLLGSTREINNSISAIISNTAMLVAMAERNQLKQYG